MATPYGNISQNKEYGSSFKRYDTSTGTGSHSHYGPPHYHPHPPIENPQPSFPPPPPPEHFNNYNDQPEPLPVVNHNNILHEIAAPQSQAQAPLSMGVGVNVDVAVENYDNPPNYQNQQELQQQQPQPNYYTDYTNTNVDNGFTNNDNNYNTNHQGAPDLGQIETNQINEPTSLILPPPHQPQEQTSDFSQPPVNNLHVSGTSSSNAYYSDYPDFSSDDQTGGNNVPSMSVPNYSTNYMTGEDNQDLDRNSYKNVQYRRKRDLSEDHNERVVRIIGFIAWQIFFL